MEATERTVKIFIGAFIGALLLQSTYAQVHQPIKWSFSAIPINKSEAALIFTASLEDGWHIYSQFIGNNGPLPTTFTFKPSEDYSLIGNTQELCVPVKSYSKLYKMNLIWFEKTATFSQKVKVHSSTAAIKGKIEFKISNEEEFFPPEQIEFSLAVKVDEPERKQIELLIDPIQHSEVKQGTLIDSTKIAVSTDSILHRKEGLQNSLTQSNRKPSPIVIFLTVLVCFSILTVMFLPFLMKPRMPSGSIKASRLTSFFLITGKAWRTLFHKRNEL